MTRQLLFFALLVNLMGCATTSLPEVVRIDDCPGATEAYLQIGCQFTHIEYKDPHCMNCLNTKYFVCRPGQRQHVREYLDLPPGSTGWASDDLCQYRQWKVVP